MPKAYSPADTEGRWYAIWEERGYFRAGRPERANAPTYTIAIPPPNVTGTLHMGHACRTTFEDVLTRYHRMRGFDTLWIPGIDHAGIATQVVVERQLARENLTRFDLGREKFIERVWQWKEESGGTILRQLRKMGASCDWSRTKFTMDPDLSRAVTEAFVRLYEEGLIYRGTRLVNWDVQSQTVLSDLEVEQEEGVQGELFDFAYPLADGSGEIVVSTTRPETMLGDTAIAVHPDDPRYQPFHGKSVKHPFVDRLIPIICDAELVDPKFGTGAVKVTPAHDWNDYETGKRHDLPQINILEKDGTLNENAGPFKGMERFAARKAVKEKLEELGLARGVKKHVMTLPRSQRSGTVVEPMISTQWFVRMEPLAKPAIEAVEQGRIKILPEEWVKTYFHWLRNIQDWCISRQLWWGHSIPAQHCGACGEVHVSRTPVDACKKCGSTQLTADPDVLDTWFSSALWPFSTLGWPEETPDLARYYPTQDLETGYDILFFWVARMIMMGIHFMGEPPFSRVLLAGLVTDERGEKMSKVKGNVIDPLDVIHGATGEELVAKAEKAGAKASGIKYLKSTYPNGFETYGADALRMTLLSYSPQAKRIALSIKRIEGYRNFANKLWNASRYALMRLEGLDVVAGARPTPSSLPNRFVLSRLAHAIRGAREGIDAYRLDDASQALYHFVWDELCDWYLELSKPLLDSGDESLVRETAETLLYALEVTLRALHPMMPFITEEIWQRLPKTDAAETIMLAPYPDAEADALEDAEAEASMAILQDVISRVRGIRAEHDLPRAKHVEIVVEALDDRARKALEEGRIFVEALAGGTLQIEADGKRLAEPHAHFEGAAVFAGPSVRGAIPGVIDPEKERARLTRELAKIEKELDALEKKLGNESFVARAPADVVEKAKADRDALAARKAQIGASLARLSG
ncbi:MAG: valine--tRNA ligase [Myxococcales bacterium]|nr:valine--tRNA ligase [Myxococcales bacterium]